ncbi:MAG: hypothetical protein GY896_12295 [Gammaproteobacteria bacterium]|nr:hypothetical protein [Gammaproteobacteria bacterium]
MNTGIYHEDPRAVASDDICCVPDRDVLVIDGVLGQNPFRQVATVAEGPVFDLDATSLPTAVAAVLILVVREIDGPTSTIAERFIFLAATTTQCIFACGCSLPPGRIGEIDST